jgi:hypothetical protein
MQDINYYGDEEILEDLRDLLGTQNDYERTMNMLDLTEEESLIFNRATLQLKKRKPKMPVLRRAHQILIAKSYHNHKINNFDTQSIMASAGEKQNTARQILHFLNTHAIKIIFGILFILIIQKIL